MLPTVQPPLPAPKSPEQLAAELEERVRLDAERQRRWRRRRETYRVVTLLAGMTLPGGALALVGGLSAGSVGNWIDLAGWGPLLTTSIAGMASAALLFAGGWGVIRGMMCFAAVFVLTILLHRGHLGALYTAMPLLVSFYVLAGAAVGYLVVLEDDT
jgi:hypothetical protein